MFYVSSGKYRKPAWTDRVLWKVSEERKNTVQLECYTSQQSYLTSDHRPVGASLMVDLNVSYFKCGYAVLFLWAKKIPVPVLDKENSC